MTAAKKRRMRKVLIVGSILCCIPGMLVFSILIIDVIENWEHFIRNLTGYGSDVLFITAYTTLAFAPAIILVKARNTDLTRSRIVIMGTMEAILIVALWTFLAFWDI
jgi:hypothetical protein